MTDFPTPQPREAQEVLAELAAIMAIPQEALLTDPSAAAAVRIVFEMLEDGPTRADPVRTIMRRVGDRWSPVLLQLLEPGPTRFLQLRRIVSTILDESISNHILSGKLHDLERDGFVQRVDLGGARPAVEYSLTPLGMEFVGQIRQLIAWSRATIPAVRSARIAWDAAAQD